MREKFIPLVTVSCVGTLSVNGDLVSPCEILSQEVNSMEYVLTFVPHSNVCKNLLFEVNMQETKLFQDTTVESKNPTMNNAFGGVAFIGNTKAFGVQIGMKIVGEYSSVDEVFELCKEVLADFQCPNKIEIVSELPQNASGKIIRRN